MVKAELERALDLAKRELADAEAELRKWDDLGLSAWNCPASPGEPVCVTTEDDDPQGYSVNLYIRGGSIVGAKVYRKVTGELEGGVGLVPLEDD